MAARGGSACSSLTDSATPVGKRQTVGWEGMGGEAMEEG